MLAFLLRFLGQAALMPRLARLLALFRAGERRALLREMQALAGHPLEHYVYCAQPHGLDAHGNRLGTAAPVCPQPHTAPRARQSHPHPDPHRKPRLAAPRRLRARIAARRNARCPQTAPNPARNKHALFVPLTKQARISTLSNAAISS